MPENIFQNLIGSVFIFSNFSLCMKAVHCAFNPVIAYRHRTEDFGGVHFLSQGTLHRAPKRKRVKLYPEVANFFSESLNSSTGPDCIGTMKITKIRK